MGLTHIEMQAMSAQISTAKSLIEIDKSLRRIAVMLEKLFDEEGDQ